MRFFNYDYPFYRRKFLMWLVSTIDPEFSITTGAGQVHEGGGSCKPFFRNNVLQWKIARWIYNKFWR